MSVSGKPLGKDFGTTGKDWEWHDGGVTELPDEALITRLRAGDAGAYEILLRRYNRRLFRVTRSILRDDDDAVSGADDRDLVHHDPRLNEWEGTAR